MASTVPTQTRSVDPFDSRASSAVNALTRMVSFANNCILTFESMEVTKSDSTHVGVSSGKCIKDDVLIEISSFTADMEDADFYITPNGGTEMSEDGYYYIVLQYTYVKSQPAPVANIKLIKPSQRSSLYNSTCLFLKAIEVSSQVIQDVYDFDPENTNNKRIFAAFYTAADSVAISTILSSRTGRVCLDSEGIKAWDEEGTPNLVLSVDTTGNIIVGYETNNQILLSAGIIDINSNSLSIIGSGNSGVTLNNSTSDALHIIAASGDAIKITNSTSNGVEIINSGNYGIKITTATSDSLHIVNSGNNSIHIENAGDNAIHIVTSTNEAIHIENSGGHGLYISDTGNAAGDSGIKIDNAYTYGIHIVNTDASTGSNALQITNAKTNAINITNAGNDGIHITYATNDGIRVESAHEYGIRVLNTDASTGKSGICVDNAHVNGILISDAGQYGLKIGNCTTGTYGPLNITNAGVSGASNLNTTYSSAGLDTLAVDSNHDLYIKTAVGIWTKLGGGTYNLDSISDGSTYGRVKLTSLTSNEVDHTKILNIGSNSHTTIDSHISSTAAHGATGAVVGTTNTQTLTNKRLTSPKINEDVILSSTSSQLNRLYSNYGINITLANTSDHGIYIADTNSGKYGICIADSNSDAINVTTTGGYGLYVGYATLSGVRVQSSNNMGMMVAQADTYGFYAGSCGDSGFYAAATCDCGLYIAGTAHDYGIYIATATYDSIKIANSGSGYNAIRIDNAGDNAILITGASDHALEITGSTNPAIYINSGISKGAIEIVDSGAGYSGITIDDAGAHAIWIKNSEIDGIHIDDCDNYAIQIDGCGNSAIKIDSYGVGYSGIEIAGIDYTCHLWLHPMAHQISSPSEGMIIYDSSTHMLYCYNSVAWMPCF